MPPTHSASSEFAAIGTYLDPFVCKYDYIAVSTRTLTHFVFLGGARRVELSPCYTYLGPYRNRW